MATKQGAKFEMYQTPLSSLAVDVEPVRDDYFIFWLFKHKCCVCGNDGEFVVEIWEERRDWVNNWKSRVVLCKKDKSNFLKNANKGTMANMAKQRRTFLAKIGREKYV